MKRPSAFSSALLLLVFLVGVSTLVLIPIRREKEPAYAGKTLSEWLATRYTTNKAGGLQVSPTAAEAVRNIGTSGVPTLLRMLNAHDSKITRSLRRIASGLPFARQNFRDAGYLKGDALYGFEILGDSASNAVPELIRIYVTSDPAFTTRDCAVWALGYVGPPANEAIPLLMQDLKSTNELVRYTATTAIARIRREESN